MTCTYMRGVSPADMVTTGDSDLYMRGVSPTDMVTTGDSDLYIHAGCVTC